MNNEEPSKKTEVRPMPDTVRTAGKEDVRDTDMGTILPKSGKEIKKTVIKGGRKIPDTVRTAGKKDIMDTDD